MICGQEATVPKIPAKTCGADCRAELKRRGDAESRARRRHVENARQRRWRENNPETYKATERRRESKPERLARKAAAVRVRREMETGICRNPAIRTQVYMQAAGVCALCGTVVPRETMTLDHIVAIMRGGPDTIENLQLAHFACNARKGA